MRQRVPGVPPAPVPTGGPGRSGLAALLALALLVSAPPGAEPGEAEASPFELLRGRALEAESRRDWPAALEAWREAGTARPGEVSVLTGISRCALRLERVSEALKEAERAIAADPQSGEALVALGEALLRAGELERALETLERAVPRSPEDARGHLALGRLLVASGRYERGLAEINRALALAPEDPDVLLQASGAATSREESILILERYLALSGGEDPDRRESVRGTLALYRALGATRTWVLEGRPDREKLALWPVGRGGSRLEGFVIELTARDRGGEKDRTLRCLFDSGASGLYLSPRAAERLDRRELSEGTVFGGGGSGRHATRRILLPVLSAGEIRFRDAVVIVSRAPVDRHDRYDGIIGADVFDEFRQIVDIPARRLVLESSRAGDGVDGGPDGAGRSRQAGPWAAVETDVWRIEGQLLVRVGLNGGRSGLMMLDTGASRTVVDLQAAASLAGVLRRESPSPAHGFGGAVRGTEEISGLEVSFAGLEPPALRAIGMDLSGRSRLAGVEITGFLGLDALRGAVLDFEPGIHRLTVRASRR